MFFSFLKFSSLITVFLMVSNNLVLAVGTREPPITKGTSITIESFQPETQTYELKILNKPAIGPNVAAKEDLFNALGFTKKQRKTLKKEPLSIKGIVYSLKRDLPLLNRKQIINRLSPKQRKEFDHQVKKYKTWFKLKEKKRLEESQKKSKQSKSKQTESSKK